MSVDKSKVIDKYYEIMNRRYTDIDADILDFYEWAVGSENSEKESDQSNNNKEE